MTDEIYGIIHDTVEKILTGFCGLDAWTAFEERGVSVGHWGLVEQSGILKAGASEDRDGAGLELEKVMNLVGLSGYHACPLPIAETLVSYWLAEAVGMEIDRGSIVTFADEALCDLPELSARGLLNGQTIHVPYGNFASHILVQCRGIEHNDMLVCVRRSDVRISAAVTKNPAGIPQVSFQFADTPVVTAKSIRQDTAAFHSLRSIGALMRSHQMAGAMKRAIEITIAYVMERKQFGRPLGKFQAVQQMVAVAAAHVVSSETIAHAASQASQRQEASFLIAAAKSWVSDSVKVVTDACHQSHGAMGFTHEYHLHYFTRRLWSWRDEFGTEYEWQRRIGKMAVEAGPEALWALITSCENSQIEGPLPPLAMENMEAG